ncbi:MAG: SDR family oxidoreductase [Desulfobacteraceae bacterium]|nr:SDR family oxidoreductase [Desulfobacteraceae bacterium]
MAYFKDKKILITGAASGLGRQMALIMAGEGGKLILWDIDCSGLDRLLTKMERVTGRVHSAFVCDVSKKEQIYKIADEVKKQHGTVDIVINNAGVVSGRSFLECDDRQIQKTMDINTMALFWTAKAFLPEMITRNRGHLVTISSAAGLVGTAKLADYCASKFAAFGFDEAIRSEMRKRAPGVKTTVICPYYINTGMFDGVQTRFAFLLPILREEYAANRIVAAIRRRRPRLFMPRMVYSVPLFRVLPVQLFDWLVEFFGINVSMTDFKGRKVQKGE